VTPITHLPAGTFYGQIRGRRELDDLTLVESAYLPGLQIPTHVHARAFFYLVLEGVCTETCDGTVRTVEELTLVFHPAGSSHSDRWHGGIGRCFSFEVPLARLELAADNPPLPDHSVELCRGDAIWLATQLYREFRRAGDVSRLAIDGLLLEILAAVTPDRSRKIALTPPKWLTQSHELIHDRYTERLLLEEIAGAVGVHAMHLCRVFRKQFGCSVGQYIRTLRLERASRELVSSRKTVVEIAIDSGYSDQSHFTHEFRSHTGMTPVEFRRHLRPR